MDKKQITSKVGAMDHLVNRISGITNDLTKFQNEMLDTRFTSVSPTNTFVSYSTSDSPTAQSFNVSASMSPPGQHLFGPEIQWGSQWEPEKLFPTVESKDVGKYPTVDIVDEKEWYRIDIYVAGVEKDEINIFLEAGNYLGVVFFPAKMTIRINKKKQPGVYKYKESKQSSSNRIVSLPDDAIIGEESPRAELKNGVLTFQIPRIQKMPTPPKPINVILQ